MAVLKEALNSASSIIPTCSGASILIEDCSAEPKPRTSSEFRDCQLPSTKIRATLIQNSQKPWLYKKRE